jgi:hypothetical protein
MTEVKKEGKRETAIIQRKIQCMNGNGIALTRALRG